jgi:hypothetical protein
MFSWIIIGGSAIAVILAVIGFYMAVRPQGIFGTESHKLQDVSGLTPIGETPPSGEMNEANFGTESHKRPDVSGFTPTDAAGSTKVPA